MSVKHFVSLICKMLYNIFFYIIIIITIILHPQLNLPIVNRISPSVDTATASASSHSQPPLMGNVDPSKIDEIRRTVYVGNLNSQVIITNL